MYSTNFRKKGNLSVDSKDGKLRIHLPRYLFNGKNTYLYLRLPDTPENRVIAEAKAQAIEADIALERFDHTLAKYKPQSVLKVVEEKNPKLLLKDLWARYVAFKTPQWSISTLHNQVAQASRDIESLPMQGLTDAIEIRDYLLRIKSLEATRRLLVQLSACCRWAIKSKLINVNPFEGLATEIKTSKSEDEENEINPFTRQERDRIIEAFETNQFGRYKTGLNSHSSYASYVKFLFFTGCRPSEAIGLEWADLTNDFIYFNKAVVVAGKAGIVKKKGLKTQAKRRFPVNDQLREILQSIKPANVKPEDLVFGRNGEYLNQQSFRGVWKKLLISLGIEVRKPYQTRHTYITLQIANGESSTQVGRWVGTSTQMIEQHYLGDISHIKPSSI